MPFHINHSGEAPISTFLRVNAAKETVGAPENTANTEATTPEAGEAGPSNPPKEDVVANTEPQPNTVSVAFPAPGGSLAKRATDATTRFISTFRGRTIQGLKLQLPEGYGGVVLRGEGVADGKRRDAKNGEDERRRKPKSKTNGKGNAATAKGRTTRSKTRAEEQDDEAEPENMDVDDDKNPGVRAEQDHSLAHEETGQTLAISSQFSSFVLWQADHPVDENRDDYVRSLTEWTQLAHLVPILYFRRINDL
ncbi:hypothetical protein DXG03_003856 [Asterophora parasitica]|uniref:Uncharacterized protein n=1 Tax=Asterophora parasitica TaxID=117018 RepID=A0A9P7G145_9AGAR|nr:hypothetical protein DXG03_003856 [Asterophora parasitica]